MCLEETNTLVSFFSFYSYIGDMDINVNVTCGDLELTFKYHVERLLSLKIS